MTKAMTLPMFLSEDLTHELEVGLAQLAAKKATNYIGRWSAESQFCVLVEVMEGIPFQWHVRGPMNEEGARLWLAHIEKEMQTVVIEAEPDSGSMH